MSSCQNPNCGCTDRGYTTQPPCSQGTSNCPTPDPCPETFDTKCVRYMGDNIVDFDIRQGEDVSSIIQKMVLAITNRHCMIPGSTCLSVVNLKSTLITTTTVAITWEVTGTPVSIHIEYKEPADMAWTLTSSLAPTATGATLSGLTTGTTYYIRVNATCSVGDCYSVTIEVTTK